jgi:hypothetical protein
LSKGLASVVIGSTVLVGAASCRNLDVVTASYATLAEAERAGAVDRGWMPPGLPPGAYDIREAHDLDSNRRWALFSFPASQSAALRGLLETSEASLSGQICDAPGRIEWWPIVLRGSLDAERITATGLRAYRSADGSLLFAVNWNQGRAYYWTPASRGTP